MEGLHVINKPRLTYSHQGMHRERAEREREQRERGRERAERETDRLR